MSTETADLYIARGDSFAYLRLLWSEAGTRAGRGYVACASFVSVVTSARGRRQSLYGISGDWHRNGRQFNR